MNRTRHFVVAATLIAAASSCSSTSTSTAATATPTNAAPAPEPATTTAPPTTAPPTTTAPTTATTAPTTAPATTAPPTTLSLADLANAYSEPGPYPVGVTTLTLAKGPKVEVWYPATAGVSGTDTYDVRDYTPDAIKAILTADVPASFTSPAARDAATATGSFPIVLFSHGYTGIRVQSTFLTGHLASWGMVVVAPEHPSRDLTNVLAGTASGDRADSVDDLLASIDLITADPTIGPIVDAERIAAVGHSAGGGTVLGAADDPRVDGYVSMASGALLGPANADSAATTTPPVLPGKPSFFLAGSIDAVVPVDAVTRPSFADAPSPSTLWVITGVGHNGFDDFCTFGNGTGIIGVAEASGLGPYLDSQPQLRKLGQDGCVPPAVPVATTFPIIRHAVTAWLLHLFGADAQPVGLDAAVGGAYPTPVEVATK